MKEFSLKSSADNLDLSIALCQPKEGEAVRGVFQIVHGMCEHKERYYKFMQWLAERGYAVIIHDHRGHGASVKSVEDLGYFYEGGWQAMVEDVKTVGDWARENWPGVPFTLFGHSMGSMAVRAYIKKYDADIDRLFVCGCPSDNPAKGLGKMIAGALGRIRGWHHRPEILRTLSFGAYNRPFAHEGWQAAWVCSDPQTLKEYHEDPLCQFVFTANGFYHLMALMQDCYSTRGWKMQKPGLPIHFISGADDPCAVSPKALERALGHLRGRGYENVDLKLFEGMRHEIMNETRRSDVWNYILSKLD